MIRNPSAGRGSLDLSANPSGQEFRYTVTPGFSPSNSFCTFPCLPNHPGFDDPGSAQQTFKGSCVFVSPDVSCCENPGDITPGTKCYPAAISLSHQRQQHENHARFAQLPKPRSGWNVGAVRQGGTEKMALEFTREQPLLATMAVLPEVWCFDPPGETLSLWAPRLAVICVP